MLNHKFYLNGIDFASELKLDKTSIEPEKLPEYITHIDCPLSASEEVSFQFDANPELYKRIIGVDLANHNDLTSFSIKCKQPYQVQIKKNKKKRINKKWAKRYGYKTMFKTVIMTDAKFENVINDDIIISGKHVYVS